jgi:putative ABC transport system permease protein
VALAIVLLAGAGLVVKSFLVARRTDNLGYNPRGVLTARFQMQEPRYQDPAAVRLMEGTLLERLAMQPMVEAASVQHQEFLGTFIGTESKVTLEGQAEPLTHEAAPRFAFPVSPGYFAVRQLPIVRGRGIEAIDIASAPAVAVVTGETARQLWPGQNPLGKRLRIGDAATGRWLTVVGVSGDIVGSTLGRRQGKFLYTSAAQSAGGPFELLVRFRGDPRTMGTTLKAVARTVDPDEPVEDVMTMEEGLRQSLAPVRFMVGLLLGLGLLALLLAASGIYGVMSYLVARRTRELGIRMALGAAGADVRRLVFRYGLRLSLIGLALGLPVAFALSTLLRGLLFSVSASDPWVFTSAGVLLAGIALLACWSPARRATRVDPLAALRSE